MTLNLFPRSIPSAGAPGEHRLIAEMPADICGEVERLPVLPRAVFLYGSEGDGIEIAAQLTR